MCSKKAFSCFTKAWLLDTTTTARLIWCLNFLILHSSVLMFSLVKLTWFDLITKYKNITWLWNIKKNSAKARIATFHWSSNVPFPYTKKQFRATIKSFHVSLRYLRYFLCCHYQNSEAKNDLIYIYIFEFT